MISPSTSPRPRAHHLPHASERWATTPTPTAIEFLVDVQAVVHVVDGSVDTLVTSVWRSSGHRRIDATDDWTAVADAAGVGSRPADAMLARIVAHIAAADADARVAVRVAPRRLAETGFAERLLDALAIADAAPQRLELEIGEHAVVAHGERCRPAVDRLRRAGVRLTIGDHGIGYSSFEALRTLPVDRVRIGREIVGRMFDHDRQQLIVRSMIQLAHEFGLDVVADGVDSDATLDTLAEYGCTVMQGAAVHVDRPMPRLRGVMTTAGEISVERLDAVAVAG